MKRFDEKVKDIVEVRSSTSVGDFLADPANTLAGYHFTDITSDLMAKWLDHVAGVKKGNGVALALAGFRGVGKSHFLAALSAMVSNPELRSGISDQHVAASAQRLSRRHGVVAHVRRGSAKTLAEELRNAISEVSGTQGSGESIADLMSMSAAKSGDLPPVIVIDTEFGREARVTRDDGRVLSDIAAAAKDLGIFVGLALDDDIAGADGINSSIASSFAIDYLDQEHLYKVVNTYVFTKNPHGANLLHEIYEGYRQALPAFRWSETRFSALYPLHPVIVELAPFIRLYLHEFALLGFASEAGFKILGRPANSLIGLDEVFDSIESRLRHVYELKGSFEIYDALDRNVVAKAPVTERHPAKLILKGLFLLSLTGDGVTASELAASMMLLDEGDAAAAAQNAEAVLRSFFTAMPASIKISEGADPKFLLKGGSEGDINAALDKAVAEVPADVAWPILRRQTAEKFADMMPSEHDPAVSAKCNVTWRGSIRRGEVVWTGEPPADRPQVDWRIFVDAEFTAEHGGARVSDTPYCEWRLGKLSADDIDILKRFHILQTDNEIREKFRDSVSTVLHVHLIAVEKIWQRVFLVDGHVLAGNNEYRFSEEARAAHTLSQLFTLALGDWFAAQYPLHPKFGDVLQDRQVSQLIEGLFSGAAPDTQEVQELAADFAMPLGLVHGEKGSLSLIEPDELLAVLIVGMMLEGTPAGKDGLRPIENLSLLMQGAPYGLTREAQRLVLAALVAQKKFEFVTSSGNRINHRSLDLQIVWDDIIGLGEPVESTYSDDRLLKWAGMLTGSVDLKTLKGTAAREAAGDALAKWIAEWRTNSVLDTFDRVPDEKLNTRTWRLATNVRKTFGAAAEAVERFENGTSDLDRTLQAIADAFWDSDDEFRAKLGDLEVLRQQIEAMAEVGAIDEYLLLAAPTLDPAIDAMRSALMDRLASGPDAAFDLVATRTEFEEFKRKYADHYSQRHASVMESANAKLDDYLSSNLWTGFSDLASTGWFGHHDMERAIAVVRQIRGRRCTADVLDILSRQPHCNCSFSLPDGRETEMLIDELHSVVEAGLEFFNARLVEHKNSFTSVPDGSSIIEQLESGAGFTHMSARQMQTLRSSLQSIRSETAAADGRPHADHGDFPALHPADLKELEAELDRLGQLDL